MNARHTLWLVLILSLVFAFSACGDASVDDDPADGDQATDGDDSTDGDDATDGDDGTDGDDPAPPVEAFRFVVITDTHTRLPGMPDAKHYNPEKNLENLELVVERINDEFADADFVAVTGDLVGALFSSDPDDYGVGIENPAETFKALTDPLIPPMYAVLGNHDYQDDYDAELEEGVTSDDFDAMEAVWKKVLGIDPYYSVVHKGVRLLFLNPSRGDHRDVLCATCTIEAVCTGSFDEEQLLWLEDELEEPEPVIIFMHHPPITDNNKALFSFLRSFLIHEDDGFYDIMEHHKDRVLGIFVGHGHIWERDTMFGTIQVWETGAIGDTNGNPDNIHVVEVNPEGPHLEVSIARDGANYWTDLMGLR